MPLVSKERYDAVVDENTALKAEVAEWQAKFVRMRQVAFAPDSEFKPKWECERGKVAYLEAEVAELKKFKTDAEEQTASFPVVEKLMDEIQDLKDLEQQAIDEGEDRAERLITTIREDGEKLHYYLWSHRIKGRIIKKALKDSGMDDIHIKFRDLCDACGGWGLYDLCETIAEIAANPRAPHVPYEECGFATHKDLWIKFVDDLGIENEYDELVESYEDDDEFDAPNPDDYHLRIINAVADV